MVKLNNLIGAVITRNIKYFITVIFMAVSACAFAQNQQLHFDHLGTADGLSELTPLCMLQDSKGFVWVGTEDGLNRYDG